MILKIFLKNNKKSNYFNYIQILVLFKQKFIEIVNKWLKENG